VDGLRSKKRGVGLVGGGGMKKKLLLRQHANQGQKKIGGEPMRRFWGSAERMKTPKTGRQCGGEKREHEGSGEKKDKKGR